MKNVMTRAWEIAKEGVVRFGGKVKEYFTQALVIAWKEFKTGGYNMELVQLVGSEKQIKWASDIRKALIQCVTTGRKVSSEYHEKVEPFKHFEAKIYTLDVLLKEFQTNTSAKFFIENFKGILTEYFPYQELRNLLKEKRKQDSNIRVLAMELIEDLDGLKFELKELK